MLINNMISPEGRFHSAAYSGRVFNNKNYIKISEKAVDFVLKKSVRDDGRLLSRYREGESAYALNMLRLYEITDDTKFKQFARKQ